MAWPPIARVLGVDLGERRVGLALGDETATLATELRVLRRDTIEGDARELQSLIDEHGIATMVVGMPVSLSGELGWQAQRTQQWIDEIRPLLSAAIVIWDERLTTVEADRALRFSGTKARDRKQRIDMTAAAVMLQSYLDAARSRQRA